LFILFTISLSPKNSEKSSGRVTFLPFFLVKNRPKTADNQKKREKQEKS